MEKYICESMLKVDDMAPIQILVNEDNIVRCIYVQDKSIDVYNGIKVGMKERDLKESGEIFKVINDIYDIFLDKDGNSIDSDKDGFDDCDLEYLYFTENGIIDGLRIVDRHFMEFLD